MTRLRLPPLMLWALAYGLGGFALGFLFGMLRELVLIPRFGSAPGHLIEFPLVTACIAAFGVWIGRRTSSPGLLIGIGGVCVLLLFESVLALMILGQPLAEYLAGFDVSAGALFPYGLAVMAAAPLLGRRFA